MSMPTKSAQALSSSSAGRAESALILQAAPDARPLVHLLLIVAPGINVNKPHATAMKIVIYSKSGHCVTKRRRFAITFVRMTFTQWPKYGT